MNTIWHAFWTFVLFRKHPKVIYAVTASIIPDLPQLTALSFAFLTKGLNWNTFITWTPSPFVETTALALHSIPIVVSLFLIFLVLKKRSAFPFFLGWLFHISLDLPTHFEDNYPPFWPVSNWKVNGLISYWNPEYGSLIFDIIHTLFVILAMIYLIKKTTSKLFDKLLFTGFLAYLVILEIFYINSDGFILQSILNAIPIILILIYSVKFLKTNQKK